MNRLIVKLSFFIALIVIPYLMRAPSPVLAVTNPQTSTSSVSATVLDQTFNPPTLLTPAADAAINHAQPTFSWRRPSPLPLSPLSYYDFYLDGAIFAATLPDSLTSADFYFYTASASAGTFYLTPKSDLAQGYHTWSVTAYNDLALSATSETRTFYLDSIGPFISVTQVDQTTLDWDTSLPASLPSLDESYLAVTTASPVLKGAVEASANFKISLICPSNIPSCVNQSYTTNFPTGQWSYQFVNLVAGYYYTIRASATDAGGSSTLFPDFYLLYGTAISTASPSAAPTLPLGSALTPPPGLLATITPPPFASEAPISPTPPPVKKVHTPLLTVNTFYQFLLILIILGLPAHLLMAIVGTHTPLVFVPRFLLILAFPFLRAKRYRTHPFTSLTFFKADRLDHPWQSVVSDIQGYFNLASPLPENIFIRLSAFGRLWKNRLFKGSVLPLSCLYSVPVRQLSAQERLQRLVYEYRTVPLAVACLSSTIALVLQPSYPIFLYLYLSGQYLYSEYLYPKI
jgi:hypothetical protein